MNTAQAIEFAKSWNAGRPVKDLAEAYKVKPSTIRIWVATLRKKGVKLESRQSRTKWEMDVAKVNRSL